MAKGKPKLGRGQCRSFKRADGRTQQVCNRGGQMKFGKVTGKPRGGGVAASTRNKGGKPKLGRGQCRTFPVKGQTKRGKVCNVNGTVKRVPLSYKPGSRK